MSTIFQPSADVSKAYSDLLAFRDDLQRVIDGLQRLWPNLCDGQEPPEVTKTPKVTKRTKVTGDRSGSRAKRGIWREAIIRYVGANPGTSLSDIATCVGTYPANIRKTLGRLLEDDILQRDGRLYYPKQRNHKVNPGFDPTGYIPMVGEISKFEQFMEAWISRRGCSREKAQMLRENMREAVREMAKTFDRARNDFVDEARKVAVSAVKKEI